MTKYVPFSIPRFVALTELATGSTLIVHADAIVGTTARAAYEDRPERTQVTLVGKTDRATGEAIYETVVVEETTDEINDAIEDAVAPEDRFAEWTGTNGLPARVAWSTVRYLRHRDAYGALPDRTLVVFAGKAFCVRDNVEDIADTLFGVEDDDAADGTDAVAAR